MTDVTVEHHRPISFADLQSAVETIALAQAQVGVAVIALLNRPADLSQEQRTDLSERVQRNTVKLLELSRNLLDAHDGD